MDCPNCRSAMVEGFIYSPRTLSWTPRPMKLFREADFLREGNVVLSETGLMAPAKVTAYHCPACKMIVIPYGSASQEDVR